MIPAFLRQSVLKDLNVTTEPEAFKTSSDDRIRCCRNQGRPDNSSSRQICLSSHGMRQILPSSKNEGKDANAHDTATNNVYTIRVLLQGLKACNQKQAAAKDKPSNG